MSKITLGTALLAGLAISTTALAPAALAQTAPDGAAQLQTGTQTDQPAGKFMIRLRAIGVLPQDSSSSITVIGGHVDASNAVTPEVDFSYFFTNHISAELIAATTQHTLTATDTALGHVDVGKTWILPPTLTLQYHFLPDRAFDPYLGAGLTVAFFYGTEAAGGAVTKVGLSTTAGPAIEAGFDYHLTGPWYANFDIKQVFISTTARLDGGAITAKTALNPTIIGAGIGYRF